MFISIVVSQIVNNKDIFCRKLINVSRPQRGLEMKGVLFNAIDGA